MRPHTHARASKYNQFPTRSANIHLCIVREADLHIYLLLSYARTRTICNDNLHNDSFLFYSWPSNQINLPLDHRTYCSP